MAVKGQRPLVIGKVELVDFSCPESITLGAYQSVAIHKFEGGIKTAQQFGVFPPEVIPIKAIWLAGDAEAQNTALGNYAVTGEQITMTWGPMNYTGFVDKYIPIHKHEHFIEYQLDFIPLVDNNFPQGGSSGNSQGALGSAFQQMGARWL